MNLNEETKALIDEKNEPVSIYELSRKYFRNQKRKETASLHARINPDRSLPVPVHRISLFSPYGHPSRIAKLRETMDNVLLMSGVFMIPENALIGETYQSIYDKLFKK